MVRIRHPNLFVDKCDGNCAVLPVYLQEKLVRVANLFFIIFVHFGKKMHVQIKKIAQFFVEITFHRCFFAQFLEFFAFQPQIRWFRRHIF